MYIYHLSCHFMILCILCKCSGDFAGAQISFFIYCEGSIFLLNFVEQVELIVGAQTILFNDRRQKT